MTGKSVMLEEYARKMIPEEERHLGEVDKMLRTPGDIATFAGRPGDSAERLAKKTKR